MQKRPPGDRQSYFPVEMPSKQRGKNDINLLQHSAQPGTHSSQRAPSPLRITYGDGYHSSASTRIVMSGALHTTIVIGLRRLSLPRQRLELKASLPTDAHTLVHLPLVLANIGALTHSLDDATFVLFDRFPGVIPNLVGRPCMSSSRKLRTHQRLVLLLRHLLRRKMV